MAGKETFNQIVARSLATYENDQVAQLGIRALEKLIHDKGRRNNSFWGGIYQPDEHTIEYVEVLLGSNGGSYEISVSRNPDPPQSLTLKLIEQGHVITLPEKKGK